MKTGRCALAIEVGLVVLSASCGGVSGGTHGTAGSGAESGQAADAGAESGQAADAGSSDGDTAGAGTAVGGGGAAGDGGTGGVAGVAASGEALAGVGAGAAIADAGAGGATAGGSGNGAGGNGGGGPGPTGPHWLTFQQTQGVFAYDVTRYPDSAGLVQLSSKPALTNFYVGPWSPDGHWVFYEDAQDVVCRDMSQTVPGAPLLVGSMLADPDNSTANVARLSWSADSKSAALVTGTNLVAFDPSHENPTLSPISTSIRSAAWAPVGNRLFYGDNLGFHVVSVNAGQPGTSQPLDITVFKTWSPDGRFIAAVSGKDLVLVDVTGATPTAVKVTNPTVVQPFVSYVRFSPNGKALAFIGAQARATADLYYLTLDPLGTPQAITGSPANSPGASSFAFWSPDSRWLGFNIGGATTQRRAVDVAGSVPGVPFTLKVQGGPTLSWLTKTPNTFVTVGGTPAATFVTYDLSTPEVDPVGVLLSAIPQFSLSPVGDILAADDVDAVAIRDLHAPPPPADVRVYLASSTQQLVWSPDGRFLAIIAEDTGYRTEVIQMNGSIPSKPLPVAAASPSNIIALWQPVFR